MEKGVCVCCLTYNQVKYIKDALDGFVKQVVDFPYKVLVHDDASADGTAEIVKEYAQRYPDLIVPILQSENQYSQGIDIIKEFIMPHVDLDHFAMCEGDDYWTDPEKIKKQFDYMQNNPDVTLCGHNSLIVSKDGDEIGYFNSSETDTDYSVEDIIDVGGGGGLFHTSSYMIKSECRNSFPDEFRMIGVGDYPLKIHAALCGRVHYLASTMSCYRSGTENSWTRRVEMIDENYIKLCKRKILFFEFLNDYTGKKYEAVCMRKKTECERDILIRRGSVTGLLTDADSFLLFKNQSFRSKLGIIKRIMKKHYKL